MHVLVATRRTQGLRADDYSRTIEGEFVFLPLAECDWGDPVSFREGARYFVGLESREETTTAQVIEMDITTEDVVGYCHEKLAAHGWSDRERIEAESRRMASLMLSISALLAPGVVIEKRGAQIAARRGPGAGDP